MVNALQKVVEEMAAKERKLKEYKRRIHAKGKIIEKKITDNGNIKLKIQKGEDKFNFIVLKSHVLFFGGIIICTVLMMLQWRKKNIPVRIKDIRDLAST